MTTMGDKIAARAAMRAADVPTVPGTEGETHARAGARAAAGEIGYPVMLKAAAGGGGRGMRLVEDPVGARGRLRGRVRRGRRRVRRTGRSTSRRSLVPARHVEIQVLCDTHGNVLTLGERECSIQRRHQKLVEESPSPALTPELREQMESAAERACRAVGYVNAGTFEFLLGPDGAFSFIELNARLQVEHPVTELLTGIDLVRRQLEIAAGERLELDGPGAAPRARDRDPPERRGSRPATSCPRPGTVTRFRPPLGPGVRVDTFVEDGTTISPYYDSLIAKLVAWDENRPAAIARAERMLRELVVEGVPTTRELALAILASDEFRSGDYSTSTLAELGAVAA